MPRVFVVLFINFAVLLTAFLLIEVKTRPLIQKLAYSRVSYLASKAINDAVDSEISNGTIRYDELISFEKDTEGKITALKTNMIRVNQLKVEISNIILDKIDSIQESELYIPLGNIINGDLFSGRGPKVPIKIVPTGSVKASFSNVFSSAGINQTRHQIIMVLTVNMNILTPGSSQTTSVESQVNVAETVIVGTVPGNYTYFSETDDASSTQKSAILDNK